GDDLVLLLVDVLAPDECADGHFCLQCGVAGRLGYDTEIARFRGGRRSLSPRRPDLKRQTGAGRARRLEAQRMGFPASSKRCSLSSSGARWTISPDWWRLEPSSRTTIRSSAPIST